MDGISIIAPSVFPESRWSEAEVLGAMTVLWSQHPYYSQISVASMLEILVPMIKAKQFALIHGEKQPLGYLCWAFMNEATEQDYLQNNGEIERFIGCNNGDQMWILSIFSATYSNSRIISKVARNLLFPTLSAKSLYHRGREKGFRIMHFHGSAFTKLKK